MPRHIRVETLEAGVRAVCEPYFTRPLSDINLGEVLFKLFRMAQRYELTLQPQLMLLQKTLLNIEGLSRWLDPKIDIWAVAQPVLRDIMQRQYGRIGSLLRAARIEAPDWLSQLPALPGLARQWLESDRETHAKQLALAEERIRLSIRTSRNQSWALMGSTLILSAGLLYVLDTPAPWWGTAIPAISLAALCGGVLAWWQAFRAR